VALLAPILLSAQTPARGRLPQTYPLVSATGLRLHNVKAEPVVYAGKRGLRVMLSDSARRVLEAAPQTPTEELAVIDGTDFGDGVIEAEIAGEPAKDAPAGARGFVGIAFRVQQDMMTYDAFYLRPTNGRAEDQERRNHSAQYISHPDWTWSRLRQETPSRYEAYVDLVTGAWTPIRIEVQGSRARLFVYGQMQPTLVVNDVKSGAQAHGAIALWIDAGTVAHFRNVRVTRTPRVSLTITDSVQVVGDLGELAREPMLVEHPGGALFVSGYMDPRPKLWKSADKGRTWERVNIGTEEDGAVGNSDVDLAVDSAGTLYLAEMGFDRSVGQGTSISIGVSRDAGSTWKWTQLSRDRFVDRPWVDVAPDGTAHVIWNDTAGVHYTKITDHGSTWWPVRVIHDKGGSSHLAVGPHGEVAVRVAPIAASGNKLDEGVDLIAVSTDAGATWTKRDAPGTRDWPSRSAPTRQTTPRWTEPLAWDASGNLYYFWTAPGEVRLARSADRGATWTQWQLAKSGDAVYYPYLVARGKGELAATWFSGIGPAWKAHVARINVPDAGAPSMRETTIVPESWGLTSRRGERPDMRSSAGEYLPVAFLRDGSIAVVSPIQHESAQRYGFAFWRVR
jgi:hypothetical protein